jgi:hypothetical protein
MVQAAAEEAGVTLQTDSELDAIAGAAVKHVEKVFTWMLQAGQLRALNRRYKAERLARAAAGRGMVSYCRWVEAQKAAMVLTAAGSPALAQRLA